MKYCCIKKVIRGGGLNVRYVAYLIECSGQEYILNITVRTDLNYVTEFAVFKSVDGQITFENALPVYRKEDVGTFDSLERCVYEFLTSLD